MGDPWGRPRSLCSTSLLSTQAQQSAGVQHGLVTGTKAGGHAYKRVHGALLEAPCEVWSVYGAEQIGARTAHQKPSRIVRIHTVEHPRTNQMDTQNVHIIQILSPCVYLPCCTKKVGNGGVGNAKTERGGRGW